MNRLKESKGITLMSLVVTIVVMLILASIIIAAFNGESETVETANDAKIYTELKQLQEELDKYKVQKFSSKNLRNGNFSKSINNNDFVYDGIMKEYSGIAINKQNIVRAKENDEDKEDRTVGLIAVSILKNKVKTEIESTLGKNIEEYFENPGIPVTKIEAETGKENLIEFSDVFAMDIEDSTLYYVNNGKIWKLDSTGIITDPNENPQEPEIFDNSIEIVLSSANYTNQDIKNKFESVNLKDRWINEDVTAEVKWGRSINEVDKSLIVINANSEDYVRNGTSEVIVKEGRPTVSASAPNATTVSKIIYVDTVKPQIKAKNAPTLELMAEGKMKLKINVEDKDSRNENELSGVKYESVRYAFAKNLEEEPAIYTPLYTAEEITKLNNNEIVDKQLEYNLNDENYNYIIIIAEDNAGNINVVNQTLGLVARVEIEGKDDYYTSSVQEAFDYANENAGKDGKAKIYLLKDVANEIVTTYAGKDIIFDLQGHQVGNTSRTEPTIKNVANSKLQIIDSTKEVEGENTKVGTILSENTVAIFNEIGATFTLGDDDGTVSLTKPVLIGKINGLATRGTFNFYDGVIIGKYVEGNISLAIDGKNPNTPDFYTVSAENNEARDQIAKLKIHSDAVAKIVETNEYFTTLPLAFEAVKEVEVDPNDYTQDVEYVQQGLLVEDSKTYELNGSNYETMVAPTNDSFGTAEIVVKINDDYTPVQNNYWYNCSTIFGCELSGTQKDWAIIINRNGYFAIGYNTSTIYSSSVYALDGKKHTITYSYNSGKLKFAIDGNVITTISYTPSGSTIKNYGIGWNNNSSSTAIRGTIYKVRFYQGELSDENILQNYNNDLKDNQYKIAVAQRIAETTPKTIKILKPITIDDSINTGKKNIKLDLAGYQVKMNGITNEGILEIMDTTAKKDEVDLSRIKTNGGYTFNYTDNCLKSNNKAVSSSTARGYIELDFREIKGTILVKVNAEVQSEGNYDWGNAAITKTTDNPTSNQFIRISGTTSATDYSTEVEGGDIYYLHFWYSKDSSKDVGSDTFQINKISCSTKSGTLENNSTTLNNTIKNEEYSTLKISEGIIRNTNSGKNIVNNSGKLEFTGGKLQATATSTVAIKNNSLEKVVIDGGEIYLENTSQTGINNISDGDVQFKNGIIYSNKDNSWGIMNKGKGTIEVNDGDITTKYASIWINSNGGKIKVTGGNIISTTNATLGAYTDGTIEVTGGYISGKEAIWTKSNVSNTDINVEIIVGGDSKLVSSSNSAIIAYSNGTIKINGGEITGGGTDSSILNYGNSTIEMTGGTLKGGEKGIYNQGNGNIVMTGGKIEFAHTGSYRDTFGIYNTQSGEVTIKGGTIDVSNASTVYGVYSNTGNVTIGNKDGNVDQEKPYIKGIATDGNYVGYGLYSASGLINFYDGIITGKKGYSVTGSVNEIEEDSQIITDVNENQESSYLSQEPPVIAKIGNLEFNSIKEAVDYCNENYSGSQMEITVIRNSNITTDSQIPIVNNEVDIKLDLAGYTTNVTAKTFVENNGKLQITDTSESNTAVIRYAGSGTNSEYASVLTNKGILNFDKTTINTNSNYVYGVYNEGEATISGGKINGNITCIYNIGELKITDGEFAGLMEAIYNTATGKIEIDGGTFSFTAYGWQRGDKSTIKNYGEGQVKIKGGTVKVGYNGNSANASGSSIMNYENGIIEIDEECLIFDKDGGTSAINNKSTGKIYVKGGTINVSGGDAINNESTGEVYIAGGTINGIVGNYSTGKVEMTKGKIQGSHTGIAQNGAGTVIVDNEANIEVSGIGVSNSNNSGKIEIKGGTVKSTGNTALNNAKGQTIITGGKVISTSGYGIYNGGSATVTIGNSEDEVSVEIPEIEGKTYGIYNDGTFKFFDGKITGADNQSIYGNIAEVPEDYEVVKTKNDNSTETAILGKDVPTAKIGETEYKTLQDAIDAVPENEEDATTIEMLRSVTYLEPNAVGIVPNTKKIKLDLAGYTISSSKYSCIIDNNGELEITDNTENKNGTLKMDFAGDANNYNKIVYNKNKLVMTTATINTNQGNTYGIYNEGEATISGGKINGNITCIYNIGELKIADGEFAGFMEALYNTTTGKVEISGGTLSFTAYGWQSGDKCTIKNYGEGQVKITGGTVRTGSNAHSGNKGGSSIINYGNGIIEIDENATIYDRDDGNSAINNYSTGTIYVKGGTINVYGGDSINNSNAGNVYITGGTINRQVGNYSTGTVEMTGGKIEGSSTGIAQNGAGTVIVDNEANIEVSGIGVSNSNNSGKIEIKGGTVKSTGNTALNNAKGQTIITGGKVISTSGYGINNASDATLTLGNIEDEVNINIPEIEGKTYGVYNNGTLNFYDGKITGADSKSIYGNITQIPENYEVIKTKNDNGTETATLSNNQDAAKIGETTYSSLQDAINAVPENAEDVTTIELLRSITLNINSPIGLIPENKKVKIDLAGYTISSSNYTCVIKNDGKLEITDSSTAGSGIIKYEIPGSNENYNRIIYNTGTLNLEKATLTTSYGNTYGIYNEGEATISGGKINGSLTCLYNIGELKISGGEFSGVMEAIYNTTTDTTIGRVEISGGTFSFTAWGWQSGDKGTIKNYGEGQIKIKGGTVKTGSVSNSGNKGGSSIINYETGAIEIEEDAIIYDRDESISAIINGSTGNVYINGGTVNVYGNEAICNNSTGKIYVNAGTVGGAIHNNSTGNAYITGGIMNGTVRNNSSGSIEITGGMIQGSQIGVYNNGNGAITFESAQVSVSNVGLQNNGSGTIEIKSGLINSTNNNSVKNTGIGTIYIKNNPTIIGYSDAILNETSGKIEITGGIISSTNASGVKNLSTGSITIGEDDMKVNQAMPSAIGKTYGIYNANDNGHIYFYDGKAVGAKLQSTYGTISIPEKYKITKTSDEEIETATLSLVGVNVSKACVNDVYYSNFQEAIDVCGPDDEISVINTLTISENITIAEGKTIKINMNGKTITYTGTGTFITNNGTLNITGTGHLKNEGGGILGGTGNTTVDSSVTID